MNTEKYLTIFNARLTVYEESIKDKYTNEIANAVLYSLKNAGKRIRPILFFVAMECFGMSPEQYADYALAIEMIHTYSLIHDDLPAMDNDDFRRGKPSNHKVFGEAIAILAGDALLNGAFELLLKQKEEDFNLKAVKLIAEFSGLHGMIGGQVQDVINEGSLSIDETLYNYIIENKTAKLISLPLLVASILSDNKYLNELIQVGKLLGYIFQITDDILDVESSFEMLGKTVKKDEKSDKLSAVKVYGLDGATKINKTYYENCKQILTDLTGFSLLVDILEGIYLRTR